jgi:2-amino-4-hydroxy-6-hydroxymethyldihydropteridine diphosphokinase
MAVAFIGLGANLGERQRSIGEGVAALQSTAGITVLAVSTLRETEPVGVVDQPRFLNGVASIETRLSPRELLTRLLEIEAALGRSRDAETRFGPRVIDLDILLYGDVVLDEPGLTVPHPRLHERPFALEPLAELDPDAIVPGHGRVQDILGERRSHHS